MEPSLGGKQDRKRKTSYANKITYTRQTPWLWVSGRRVPVFPTSPTPTRRPPYSPLWKKRDERKAARLATAKLLGFNNTATNADNFNVTETISSSSLKTTLDNNSTVSLHGKNK